MLQTQVNYWTLVENRRHNLVTEGQEQQNIAYRNRSLDETVRHNQVTETLGFQTLQEQTRHNVATEDIDRTRNEIQAGQLRVAQQQVALGYANLALGQAQLSETVRSHKANEAIGWGNVQVSQANANTNRMQALTAVSRMENDYEISKANVRINQQNADTDYRNSIINERNSVIRSREANVKEFDAVTNIFKTVGGWFK
jgi:hypothetical protein